MKWLGYMIPQESSNIDTLAGELAVSGRFLRTVLSSLPEDASSLMGRPRSSIHHSQGCAPLISIINWFYTRLEHAPLRLRDDGCLPGALYRDLQNHCPFLKWQFFSSVTGERSLLAVLEHWGFIKCREGLVRQATEMLEWRFTTREQRQEVLEDYLTYRLDWGTWDQDHFGELPSLVQETFPLVILVLRQKAQGWVSPLQLSRIWLRGWFCLDHSGHEELTEATGVEKLLARVPPLLFRWVPFLLGWLEVHPCDGRVRTSHRFRQLFPAESRSGLPV